MAAQVVLKEKKSTYGSPYGYYTVTLTPSDRTANSVTVKCTVSAHLAADNSSTQFGVKCGLYFGDKFHEFVLVEYGTWWRGSASISKSTTVTVSGLTVAQTTITDIKFRAVAGDGASVGPSLSATKCSNLTIDMYGGVAHINDGGTQKEAIPWVNDGGTWKQAIPWVNDNGTWKIGV